MWSRAPMRKQIKDPISPIFQGRGGGRREGGREWRRRMYQKYVGAPKELGHWCTTAS